MADSKDPAAIPVWQRKEHLQDKSTIESSTTSDATSKQNAQVSDTSRLLEQAKKFLGDESILDAPRDRKIAFLETKGLPTNIIEELLGAHHETTSTQEPQDSELKTVHDSEKQDLAAPSLQTASAPASDVSRTTSVAAPDIPPIITYPEFLLKPQKPPPLVTVERLANAAYLLAGVSALTYGASKYLIQPMLETLTDARHDFAQTTIENLQKLNTKLESSVSHVPYIPSSTTLKKHGQEGDDDTESITSDPTELFHRDIATQTSPQPSRTSSLTSADNLSSSNKLLNQTLRQADRLESLHATLSSLNVSVTNTNTTFKQTITDTQAVLDKMENSWNPFRSEYSIYTSAATDKKKKEPQDEAAKFKAEIRSLKGAFLGARNFPTARPTSNYGVAAGTR